MVQAAASSRYFSHSTYHPLEDEGDVLGSVPFSRKLSCSDAPMVIESSCSSSFRYGEPVLFVSRR